MVCPLFFLLSLVLFFPQHDSDARSVKRVMRPAVAGWKRVSGAGLSFQLPSNWKTVAITPTSFDKGVDTVFGGAKYADVRKEVRGIAKDGTIKIFGVETPIMGPGLNRTCLAAIVQEPPSATLEEVVNFSLQQDESIKAPGTKPKAEYLTLKSGRTALITLEIKPANPASPNTVSFSYVSLASSRMRLVTFSAPASDRIRIRRIADKAMSTFQFIR